MQLTAQIVKALQAGADDPLIHAAQTVSVTERQATHSAFLVNQWLRHSEAARGSDKPSVIALRAMDKGASFAVLRDLYGVSVGGKGRLQLGELVAGLMRVLARPMRGYRGGGYGGTPEGM